jgi:hypothetical protein
MGNLKDYEIANLIEKLEMEQITLNQVKKEREKSNAKNPE